MTTATTTNPRPSSLDIVEITDNSSETVEVTANPMARSSNKRTDLFDMYDLHYNATFVQVTWYKDLPRIHLRTRQNGRFSTNGIALNQQEWIAFESLWDSINNEFESGTQSRERSWFIGNRNVIVSMKKYGEVVYLDIHKRYDIPGKRHYIRKGCTLNRTGFKALLKCSPLIREDLELVSEMQTRRDQERAENEKMIEQRLSRLSAVKQNIDNSEDPSSQKKPIKSTVGPIRKNVALKLRDREINGEF